jgi:hypothetical protein
MEFKKLSYYVHVCVRASFVCVYVCVCVGKQQHWYCFKQISLVYEQHTLFYDELVDCVGFYDSTNLIKR